MPLNTRSVSKLIRVVLFLLVPANTLALRITTPAGPLDLLLTPATQMRAQPGMSGDATWRDL